jgi:hypothetical protein
MVLKWRRLYRAQMEDVIDPSNRGCYMMLKLWIL